MWVFFCCSEVCPTLSGVSSHLWCLSSQRTTLSRKSSALDHFSVRRTYALAVVREPTTLVVLAQISWWTTELSTLTWTNHVVKTFSYLHCLNHVCVAGPIVVDLVLGFAISICLGSDALCHVQHRVCVCVCVFFVMYVCMSVCLYVCMHVCNVFRLELSQISWWCQLPRPSQVSIGASVIRLFSYLRTLPVCCFNSMPSR